MIAFLLFSLALVACQSQDFEWLPADGASGSTSAASVLAVVPGECRDVRLVQVKVSHGGDASDRYVSGIRSAAIKETVIATIEATGRTWEATAEAVPGAQFGEGNRAPIFRVCGVHEGMTTIVLEPADELGRIPIEVRSPATKP